MLLTHLSPPDAPPQAEEEKEKARKAAEVASLMAEVAATNAEQIKRKELMKVREQEEDARIADYVRQKDLKEQVGASLCLIRDLHACSTQWPQWHPTVCGCRGILVCLRTAAPLPTTYIASCLR